MTHFIFMNESIYELSFIFIYKEAFILLFVICFRTYYRIKTHFRLNFTPALIYMWNHYFHFYLNLPPCGSSTGSSLPSSHLDSWIKTPKSSSSVLMMPVKPPSSFVSNKTSWSKWIRPNNHTPKNLLWEKFVSKPGISEDTKPPEKLGEITSLTSMVSFTWSTHQIINVSNKVKCSCKAYCKCQSWKKCQSSF